MQKDHVGIELPVASITIAGNAIGSWGSWVLGSEGEIIFLQEQIERLALCSLLSSPNATQRI